MSNSTATVTITFPDLSPAEASQIAQELEAALIQDGMPSGHIKRVRANADAQDLGNVVQVAVDAGLFEVATEIAKNALNKAVEGAAHKAGSRAMQALLNLLKRRGTRAEVKAPTGEVVVVGEQYRFSASAQSPAASSLN